MDILLSVLMLSINVSAILSGKMISDFNEKR